MKFTEEQYQKIVNAWDNEDTFKSASKYVIDLVNSYNNYLYQEALAIGNEFTREWAHEQFVEKEKKYYWTTPLVAGIKYALIKENGKYVLSDMYLTGKGTPLTELEVVNIGLKTHWFNKEEVE